MNFVIARETGINAVLMLPGAAHQASRLERCLVSCADLRCGLQGRVERFELRQRRTAARQSFNHFLSRNIANQGVLRKRTTAEAADCGVEAATTGVVGG